MPLVLLTKSRPLSPSGGMEGVLRTRFVHYLAPPQPWVTTRAKVSLKNLKGRQVTASENHPGWADASPTDGDVGGPFSMELRSASFAGGGSQSMQGHTIVKGVGYVAEYKGPVLAVNPDAPYVSWPTLAGRSNATLEALGTKAVAIVKPTNSIADLATALIELYREGLPKMVGATLWRDSTKAARSAGLVRGTSKTAAKEYLNLEFALRPLVNDMQDVYKALTKADTVYKQYERDAGKVVRRKLEFPSEKWTDSKVLIADHVPFTVVDSSVLKSQGNASNDLLRGRLIQTDKYSRRTWFSGAFTYHLPRDWYKKGSSGRMNALLGTDITPEVVWNITPWSWFADWFANTGDVISNLTDMAADGLVLHYGYIMEHERHERTYSYEGPTPYFSEVRPSSVQFVVETKRRLKATPYGFGLTWEGFSSRQKAILAALGISKSGKGK